MRVLRRRSVLPFAASLVLHGLLLLVLRARPAREGTAPPEQGEQREAPVVLEVDVLAHAEPPRAVTGASRRDAPLPPPQRAGERPPAHAPERAPEHLVAQELRRQASRAGAAGDEARGAEVEVVEEGRAEADGTGARVSSEVPAHVGPLARPSARARLLPQLPGVDANEAGVARPGRTLRPGEGPEESSEAALARLAEEGRAVVQGLLADAAAAHRVDSGRVDTYFQEMTRALRAEAQKPPPFTPGASWVNNLVSAWQPGAAAYGRTGNPYAEGQQPEGRREMDEESPLARTVRERPGSSLDTLVRQQQAGARLREFADGRFGQGIVALLELRQARDGRMLGAALVRSSGSPTFDQHVLRVAPKALAALPPPPAEGLGLRTDGMRTLWSFEGRIVYRRARKPEGQGVEAGLAALGHVAMNALTQGYVPNTGTFDETTGEARVVDLTNPDFECRVRLLRVY